MVSFNELLSIVKNPKNAIFKVATISNNGINNVKYAVFGGDGAELLSIWGCDMVNIPPKWVMEYITFNGAIETLTHEQNRLLFCIIANKYKNIEKNILLVQNRQKIRS